MRIKLIIFALAITCAAAPARANWAQVQAGKSADCGGATSCTNAFTVSVTNGNNALIGLTSATDGTGAPPTINTPTDSGGNTYACQTQQVISNGTASNTGVRICCAPITQATGADTVTFSIASAGNLSGTIWEGSGGSCTTDGGNFGTQTSTTTVTTSSYSTTAANDIIFAQGGTDNNCVTWTAGTTGGVTMTLAGTDPCTSVSMHTEFLIVSSVQTSVTTSITGSSSGFKYVLVAQAYKAASGGGSTPGFNKRRKLEKYEQTYQMAPDTRVIDRKRAT